ncbi:glycosyltransferase [Methylocystis parvus]|uniref:Glycosyltransferase n=1 Tax=Methylocystis parvus TaxID=134 RepID=A0A6B8M5A4_9HYPH|nr:glycosyltransferase [Methylocystis parvus]QGM97312.1 glycosyltransferase [Methylocystis parvus]WBJ98777.1 glycosyltransferase [Methylocystis parvus OBBP]
MTQRRKLVFYTHALAGGGAERVFARLASGFAARGDRVTFVVDFEAQENLDLLSREVDLIVLPRGHARGAAALAKLLRRAGADASLSAISVSNLKHAAAAALAGRLDRAIISYHGFYESESARLSNIGYRLTPVLSRAVGATVAVSDALRNDLVARFFVPERRIRKIYNPAAPEPFPDEPTADDLAARAPITLAMGRLVPDKDFLTLIRAFARISDPEARLVILGEGPERDRLGSEARALGVAARVAMPGFTADIGRALSRAKCLVISSERESFGLSCVEGLAYGLPVIVTDCGGPAEVLGPAADDAPVPVGDVDLLARRIARALANPGDPARRQSRARAFSLEAALDAYDEAIRAVARR